MTKNKEDICKRAIHIFWETTWQEEKTEKSTLKYLSLRYVKIGQHTTYGDLLTIYNIKSNKQRKRQEF